MVPRSDKIDTRELCPTALVDTGGRIRIAAAITPAAAVRNGARRVRLVIRPSSPREANATVGVAYADPDSRQAPEPHRCKAVAARIAILIGVVGAVFYIALKTTTDPLMDSDFVDIVPPTLQLTEASVQEEPAPQRVTINFPGGYLTRAKQESGRLSPFEDD